MTRAGGAAAGLAVLLLAAPAAARVIEVGPGGEFAGPAAAARAAQRGDTVRLAPGEYYECAVWYAHGLTIEGPEDPATPAVITDATCQGKALFVVAGRDITIRRLTFTRSRVPDGNGAGIRAEGGSLTIEASRFINNESGVLAADLPDATLRIIGTVFERNGACTERRCTATLQTARLAVLEIAASRFAAPRAGDLVRSAAAETTIRHSTFEDGTAAPAGLLLALAGGEITVADSRFRRGPEGMATALVEVRDLWGPARPIRFAANTLANDSGRRLVFVRSLAAATPAISGTALAPGDTALDDSGLWQARAHDVLRDIYYELRAWLGWLKRGLRRLLPL